MSLGTPFTAPGVLGTSALLPGVPAEHPTQPLVPYSSCRAKSPPKTPLGRSVILLPYSTLGEKRWCERDGGERCGARFRGRSVHPTHACLGTYREFSERSPWKASGAISEIWLLLRSLKPKRRRWPGPLFSRPMPPSSRWVQGTTPSTRYTELGVSKTPSQCCHVGHPCHGKCPMPIGLGGCRLMAVASRVKSSGVLGDLVGAAHLHPPQLLVGGEGAWGDGLDAIELQASAKRRGRDEGCKAG